MLDRLDLLSTQGWVYQKDVFDKSFVCNIKKELESRVLTNASIGREKTLKTEIRSDKICWLEADDKAGVIQQYFDFIRTLKSALNQAFYLGLKDYESHFAQYEAGAFYKAHRDNVRGSNKRAITIITYLNENWQTKDGGQLRLHLGEMVDIEPVAGSVIAFMSDEILHEVLPAYKTRQAITGWLLK